MTHKRFALTPLLLLGACSSSPDSQDVATRQQAIMHGAPATSYPEAVVVTSSGFIPCSGAVVAPRVVLTAGHCRSTTKSYKIVAPNAAGQESTASSDWTTYSGNPATSSDTLLIFLDTPIVLSTYPTLASAPAAKGTVVVDIGRTLNGSVTSSDYVSPSVTIQGPGTPLGFPFNYEAFPDVSEDGDSGGPIELVDMGDGSSPHVIIGIVDTDTTEQNINEEEPIDLFARIDLVHDAIEMQIAAHGGSTSADGGGLSEAGSEQSSHPGGGCTVGPSPVSSTGVDAWSSAIAVALLAVRRRSRS